MSTGSGAGAHRQRQRCRTLIFAAVIGVLLATVSVVDRAWPGVVAGIVGAAVAVVVYRRECGRERSSDTPPPAS